MTDNDRRILKFLCFVVIKLIVAMSYLLIYKESSRINSIFDNTGSDLKDFDDETMRVIQTLQEYLDGQN